MQSRESRITLKRGAKRSVELSTGPSREVLKRFHSPGRFDRLRDHARALSEYRTLFELVRRDLAVPKPIAVRRTARGWELATEWIEGAVPLSDVLAGRSPWPAPAEALVRSLGALLARAHALGLDHPDLHSGNVLVAARARAWLVDVHGARLASRPTARTAVRDLVQLSADTRERLSPGLRARAFSAWHAALPKALAKLLPPPAQLAEDVERAARVRRRDTVERARKRWTRDSSACRALRRAEFSGFVSAELEGCDPLRFAAPAAEADRTILVHSGAPARELRARWYAAARLLDHGLAAARPLVFSRAPRAWAAFALPRGARNLGDASGGLGARATAESLGELAGALFDRGLCVPELCTDSLWVDERGGVWLGPVASIRALDFDTAHPLSIGGVGWPAALRKIAPGAEERHRFASAFVRAQRSGAPNRARVRAALRDSLEVPCDD